MRRRWPSGTPAIWWAAPRPFGTRKRLPVFLERSVLDLDRIYINGGRRGFLVSLSPQDIVRTLAPTVVDVALANGSSHP